MFFKKKLNESKIIPCDLNNNLKECDTVSRIKEYQNQLKDIEDMDMKDFIYLFFEIKKEEYYTTNTFDLKITLEHMMNNAEKTNLSYEEYFNKLGKKLDNYFNNKKLRKEITEKIKIEKQKIGIE